MRHCVSDFLGKFRLGSDTGEDKEKRKGILNGSPVVQLSPEGEKWAYFKGTDFVAHLKRTKTEEMKGVNLWFVMKSIGVEQCRLRIGDKSEAVWRIRFDSVVRPDIPHTDFTPEI